VFYPKNPQNQAQSPAYFAEFQLRERFLQKFPHSWDFLEKESPEFSWKTVKKYRLTEQKIWYKYTDSNLILGVRFGTTTNYGLYDLDTTGAYYPSEQEESLRNLTWELENWGINCTFKVRSSPSGGIHLYFYLSKPVSSFRLACAMKKAAFDAGLTIKNGDLEAFPNTKAFNSIYQGHRLPLQEGSYLLDKDHIPYSDRLESFLNAADQSAASNDVELLESRLEEAYEWYKAEQRKQRQASTRASKEIAEQIDYCQREIAEGFLYKIRIAVEQGFDDFHQTNDLLLCIGKLGRLAYGLSGKKLVDYIRETAVSCKGYLQYCRHKHEIHRRSSEVARWAERKWSPYGTHPKNPVTYRHIKNSLSDRTNRNEERKHNAQSRILQAMAYLEQELGELPRLVGERIKLLRETTKALFGISTSDATLKKPDNLPLWHPAYRHKEEEAETAPEEPIPAPSPSSPPEEPSPTEPVKAPETVVVSPVEEESDRQSVVSANAPVDKESGEQARPCAVVRENSPVAKMPKNKPGLRSKSSGYPLPIMKGIMLDFSQKLYWYLGGVQIATVWKPESRIEFESIQPNDIIQVLQLRDSQKNETKILQDACYGMVKPKDSDWESGIQIQLSQLQAYDLPYE
jgi:hypothetical protein